MIPWSDAEDDESVERDLFARRAQALGPAEMPALDAVLKAADRGRERTMPLARVVSGIVLAAASFAATVSAIPRGATVVRDARSIAADLDGGSAQVTSDPAVACVSDPEASTCGEDLRYASIDVGACFAPTATPASWTPATALSVYRTEPSTRLMCEPEVSASMITR